MSKGSPSKGSSFGEVVEAVAAQDETVTEVPVGDRRELRFSPDGILYEGRLIPVGAEARKRLFKAAGAPVAYWEEHSREFQAAALAEHNGRGDFGDSPILVLGDDGLITISRGEFNTLGNGVVLGAVAETLGPESELFLAKIGKDLNHLDIELVSPSKAITVRPGDVLRSGLHIAHERFGAQATVIEAFIYRLVCSNGMTQRECASRGGFMRTRRTRVVDCPDGIDTQMGQIRRLTEETWNGLQARLAVLKATSERPADVPQLLRQWLRQARMSERDLMDRLLAAWRREGAEGSVYAAVNALSDVGTHDRALGQEERRLSDRQQRALRSLAGLLSYSAEHLCPRCFSALAAGAAEKPRAA